jgi:hypothetical protein
MQHAGLDPPPPPHPRGLALLSSHAALLSLLPSFCFIHSVHVSTFAPLVLTTHLCLLTCTRELLCRYDQKDSSRFQPPIPHQEIYWGQFRDAFNRTGKPVYLYFCPRSFVDSIGPPVYDGPPREWSGELRKGLANTLLTEYHNAQDSWKSEMSNLDALLDLTNLSYSGPGFWQDTDMLQTCNFGTGSTPGGNTLAAVHPARDNHRFL